LLNTMEPLRQKAEKLRATIGSLGSAAVAFSGGTDSALVAKVAHEELGDKALAVTVASPVYPRTELDRARKVAKAIGIRHVVIELNPLLEGRFVANKPDRCFICKLGDMRAIRDLADRYGMIAVVDGTNADDLADFRPGLRATQQMRVRSPLAEARMSKNDVRRLSASMRLPTAKKPSSPCLASRIPYGEPITDQKLRMIEIAEDLLVSKGFDQVRVRFHGDTARIEVDPAQVQRLSSPRTRKAIVKELKRLGFSYVSLDLEGYRSGSLNEVLGR